MPPGCVLWLADPGRGRNAITGVKLAKIRGFVNTSNLADGAGVKAKSTDKKN
jgi:hypothetical protein